MNLRNYQIEAIQKLRHAIASGQSSEEEGGLSFDVYHNGDDLVSTDMDAMHKQMKMEEEQIMDTMCQQLQIEVNVSETQEYYKSKEVQDLDKAIDLIDE